MKTPNKSFRLSDEDMALLREQATKLGLDATGYIRLIIKLDAAAGIIQQLTCQHQWDVKTTNEGGMQFYCKTCGKIK